MYALHQDVEKETVLVFPLVDEIMRPVPDGKYEIICFSDVVAMTEFAFSSGAVAVRIKK